MTKIKVTATEASTLLSATDFYNGSFCALFPTVLGSKRGDALWTAWSDADAPRDVDIYAPDYLATFLEVTS